MLSPFERRLADYLDNERQAIALAPLVLNKLSEWNVSDSEIQRAITQVLVDALEAAGGLDSVEYLCGQRRDTLRG